MRSSIVTVSLFAAAAALLPACADDGAEGPLTWEEFQAQAYREPETGVYVINGDEPAADLSILADRYQDYLGTEAKVAAIADGVGTTQQPSIVNTVGGVDDKWSASQAMNLTYCIKSGKGKGGFSAAEHTAVKNALAAAGGAWAGAARVNFVHNAAYDASCSEKSPVTFNVGRVCSGQYLARAFFPSDLRRVRNILVDCTSFGDITPWTLPGILRHELGHTLGLRHEHTRPESGTCFEDNSWRALTAYDAASVMHYPQCNGSQTGDLVLTASDRAGIAALYP
jgi:hypothetical protein